MEEIVKQDMTDEDLRILWLKKKIKLFGGIIMAFDLLASLNIKNWITEERGYSSCIGEYLICLLILCAENGVPSLPRKLTLYYYQRVFLRIAMRYKYVYAVFPSCLF